MKYEHWSSTSTVWRLKVGMCFYTVRFKKAVLGLLLSNAVVLPQSEKPNRNGGGDKTAHFQSSKDKAGEKKSWRTEMERSTLWRKMTSTEHKIYFKVPPGGTPGGHLFQQGHAELLFHTQQLLSASEEETPQSLNNLCQSTPSQKVLPDVQVEPPVFQFLPTASCPVPEQH